MNLSRRLVASGFVFLLLLAGLIFWFVIAPPLSMRSAVDDHWVDEGGCKSCHKLQYQSWRSSHHQLAMQEANEQSVLGDFNDHLFIGQRAQTQFKRKAGGFWVNTVDDDGESADYPVAYTIGLEPLQQYLLQLPSGKLQAFDVAWDTQKKQWFELYPGQQINRDNALHWAGPNQNANFMCIDCHATGFKRNYDPGADSYASTWHALGVGCQGCHGPAARHLEWVKRPTLDVGYGFLRPPEAINAAKEVETCGRCHSRRTKLVDSYQQTNRLLDDYLPNTLSPALNEVDGKIKDEVFEYGSFVQSKMYAAGVRCTDCHDPHSASLRATGNALCTQCHNSLGRAVRSDIDSTGLIPKNYDSSEHHHHRQETAAAQCISCHMPARYFMVNDLRHDHSISVPNPVQATRLEHSDACIGCHRNMPEAELKEQFKLRFDNPSLRDGGYAVALSKARTGEPGASKELLSQLARSDLAGIRKATLLVELPRYPSAQSEQAVFRALEDFDPQVRESAISSMEALADDNQKLKFLSPLLVDPVRAVRISAAWQLAQVRQSWVLNSHDFQRAIDEYEQAQLIQLERPEAYLNLAMLYQLSGRVSEVEPSLLMALKRDRSFQPARILLAQWIELRGEPTAARKLLETGVDHYPQAADLYNALAMHLVRRGQHQIAMTQLQKAYELTRSNGRYAYAYAVGLYETGMTEKAVSVLDERLAQDPTDRVVRQALLTYAQHSGDRVKIKSLLHEITLINPGDSLLLRSQ